jgi:hypothetical protein
MIGFLGGCATQVGNSAVNRDDAASTPDDQPPADAAPSRPPRDAAPVTPESSPDAAGLAPDAGAPDDSGPAPDRSPSPDVPPPAKVCALGPPTPAELKIVDQALRAMPYVPAGTNHGNNFAYGTAAKALGDLRSMYGLSHDRYYLDQALVFTDYMLSKRNDPMTGRITWTGKREPCWPNNDDTAPDAGACGLETGAVANQLLATAKVIFGDKTLWPQKPGVADPNNYGATYEARARTYLAEATRSMDYIVAHFVNPAQHRILTPTDPLFTALGPNYLKAAGRAVPWNQQEMVTSPLDNMSDMLTLLGQDPMRVAANDVIVKASMDWFLNELVTNKYEVNGVTVFKWGYNPGDLFHVEDLAHASGDINALNGAYQRGRFGIDRSVMVGIANTFFELVAKPDGTYAAHVDGKGMRAVVSNSWTNYEEFRSGIVARLHPTLAVSAGTAPADALQVLSLRKKFCSQ